MALGQRWPSWNVQGHLCDLQASHHGAASFTINNGQLGAIINVNKTSGQLRKRPKRCHIRDLRRGYAIKQPKLHLRDSPRYTSVFNAFETP